MKNRLDYNGDGKVSTTERARAFSLAMMAMEEEKNDDWGDFDEFYADDTDEPIEDIEETVVPIHAHPKKKPTKQELEKKYQDALEQMRNAKTDFDYIMCSVDFSYIQDYKDSQVLSKQCKAEAEKISKKHLRRLNMQDALWWIFLIFGIPLIIALLFGFH